MTITLELLAELKRLEAAATPLPLALMDYGSEAGYIAVQAQPSPVMRGFTKEIGAFYRREDAELYLTFRNHLRELIEGYEELDEECQIHGRTIGAMEAELASLRTQLAEARAEIEQLKKPTIAQISVPHPGCICPPGAEAGCHAPLCPRAKLVIT